MIKNQAPTSKFQRTANNQTSKTGRPWKPNSDKAHVIVTGCLRSNCIQTHFPTTSASVKPPGTSPRSKLFREWVDSRRRGWGSRRKVVYRSNGLPIKEEKRIPSLHSIPEIFRRIANRFKIDPKQMEAITVELRLCPRITVAGAEGPLLLNQLSEGEKRLFSMIVDIARQLSRKPDGWKDIESAPGIVIIDEIDCHLHPKWQRMIVKALEDLFGGCQIIATTHSPFIIQAVTIVVLLILFLHLLKLPNILPLFLAVRGLAISERSSVEFFWPNMPPRPHVVIPLAKP